MPRKPSGKAAEKFLNSRVAVKPLGALPKIGAAHTLSPMTPAHRAAATKLRAQVREAMGR